MSNLKVYAKTIEDEALEQINTLLSQDAFKDCKVRIMPDVHAGKGCVIGFTADLGEKVIPKHCRSRYWLWYALREHRTRRH